MIGYYSRDTEGYRIFGGGYLIGAVMPRAKPKKVSLDRSDSPIGVLYSTDEVAAFMGVTPRTVQRWIREGKLPAVVVGGTYRVKREDLQAFVKAR